MNTSQPGEPLSSKPIRIWPGVAAVVLQWILWLIVPAVFPDGSLIGIFGALLCGLLVIGWWLFFSRAPWVDRLGAFVFIVLAVIATSFLVHVSIAGAMMGRMIYLYSIPAMSLALVAGVVAGRHLSSAGRRATIALAILMACGVFAVLRTDGVHGAASQLAWRWSKSSEEQLLARVHDDPAPPPATRVDVPKEEPASPPASAPSLRTAPASETTTREKAVVATPAPARRPAEWPGFRGADRDSVIHGVRINSDWSQSPPVEMWRRPIGPGWSSFAVRGNLFYTQEQRGEDEIVACYRLSNGEPVWRHRDRVRFWESNGGAGPRGTPTISNDRIYAFGATGILNALDADTGALAWSRNVSSDTGRKVPDWGFSSSPLVVGDVVIVAAAGTLVGYDVATGDRRWTGPSRGGSYSSPHRATVDGVEQVLLLGGRGAISVAPATGTVLWEYEWSGGTIIQPAMTEDGNVLISAIVSTGGVGTRRLAVTHRSGGWSTEERWTSNGLKPYFNDFVVHKGHAFGFDGNILSCIDLANGQRKWKGGRYGNGQLMLLADQDLMVVLSEEGELALVAATPDQFTEVARFKAIEGKTWNHPALVKDVLLVRNGEEMAAFRLSPAAR